MCIFSTLIIWEITLQSSEHLCAPSLPLPPLIFSYLQSLIHKFCFHLYSRSKGLHWWRRSKVYKLYMELHHVVSEHLHLGDFLLLPLSFARSIHFNSLFFIVFSIVLWFGSVWSIFKKINRLNLRSTLVLAFLWFKFYRSTLKSCFCVDFRFYHFLVIIFLCWNFRSQFSFKILIRKEITKI